MAQRIKKTLICWLAAALAVFPAGRAQSVWAATALTTAQAIGPARVQLQVAAAGTLADSVNTLLVQPDSNFLQGSNLESLAKTLPVLEHARGLAETAGLTGILPTASLQTDNPLPLAGIPISVQDARGFFETVNGVLEQKPWHHWAEPRSAANALEEILQTHPVGEIDPPSIAGNLRKIDSAIKTLRAALQNRPGAAEDNPWSEIFDGIEARVARYSRPLIVPPTEPPAGRNFRDMALKIMSSSLIVSPTGELGKTMFAKGLTHEEIRAITAANYTRAAVYVLDHAQELPLNLATAKKLSAMLTLGLVPDEIRGELYHGAQNPGFHREVEQFYEMVDSPRGREFARQHPVGTAEWLHYTISVLDVFPDANGRLSKLMADLALLKAGLAPAFYGDDMEAYFRESGPRSSLSADQRLSGFRKMVRAGQAIMRGEAELIINPNPSLTFIRFLESSPYHAGVDAFREMRRSVIEFLRLLKITFVPQQRPHS